MIIDSLDRIGLYQGIIPHAEEIAALLKAGSAEETSFDVYEKHYETKSNSHRRFEVHHHTMDLMICFNGEEVIHVCPEVNLDPAEDLPEGTDGSKMYGEPQGHAVLLTPGYFVAIFPGEAHMVGGKTSLLRKDYIHKWVIKLPVSKPKKRTIIVPEIDIP